MGQQQITGKLDARRKCRDVTDVQCRNLESVTPVVAAGLSRCTDSVVRSKLLFACHLHRPQVESGVEVDIIERDPERCVMLRVAVPGHQHSPPLHFLLLRSLLVPLDPTAKAFSTI